MIDFLGLVLSALGAISGFVWVRAAIIRYVRHRSFHDLFPKTSEIVVTCSTRRSNTELVNIPTTVEDSLAQAAVQVAFSKYGIPHRVKLHNQLTQDEKAGNLFLIAGVRSNTIMAELNDAGLLPLRFKACSTGRYIIVDHAGQDLHPEPQPGVQDYAVVGVLRNPWSRPGSSARIYFAAGLDGMGTWAAASQLVDGSRYLGRILRANDITPRGGFEGLITAHSAGALPPTTSIGKVVSLQL